MNTEPHRIEPFTFDLRPSILDASIFTSLAHCQAVLQAEGNFFVSATLYRMLYEEYDRERIFRTLTYFTWRPLQYLPSEKLELRPYLEPYGFKEEFIEEVYPYYEKSLLPLEVKHTILDEYSFLREHSSILMSTARFAKRLHRWGIPLVDGMNKYYDRKHALFEKIRGPRWIGGVLLSAAGVAALSSIPIVGVILGTGGTILILFDP